jgi:hypothetical protein
VLKTLFTHRADPCRSPDGHGRVSAWPDCFTRKLGFQHIIDVHRHLQITDEQRDRFVEAYMQAWTRPHS